MTFNQSDTESMALLKLRHKAQVTIPADLRRQFNLQEGDYLEAEATNAGILLRPVSINRREPAPEQEAEILDVVNEERKTYAAERRY